MGADRSRGFDGAGHRIRGSIVTLFDVVLLLAAVSIVLAGPRAAQEAR
jgi:hypothetical protein